MQLKKFIEDFKNFKSNCSKFLNEIKEILYNQEEKCNLYLKLLETKVGHYVNSMGKMLRDLTESQKNMVKFTTYETNCFILEFHLIVVLEAFRRDLVKRVFSPIYGAHKELVEKLSNAEEILTTLQIENKCPIKSDFSLAKTLENHHRRFIKKKINLDSKIILTSEALLEFFVESYSMNYHSNSFFCSKYYRCMGQDKDFKEQCVIVVDCIGNLVCVKYDMKLFDKKIEDLLLKNWARTNLRFVHHISETKMYFQEKNLTFTLAPMSAYSNEQAISYNFKAEDIQALLFIKEQLETLQKAKSKLKS